MEKLIYQKDEALVVDLQFKNIENEKMNYSWSNFR
jgi:hypothetical protein